LYPGLFTPAFVIRSTNALVLQVTNTWVGRPGYKASVYYGPLQIPAGSVTTDTTPNWCPSNVHLCSRLHRCSSLRRTDRSLSDHL